MYVKEKGPAQPSIPNVENEYPTAVVELQPNARKEKKPTMG